MDKKTSLITKIIVFSSIFVVTFTISLVYILVQKTDERFVCLFESLDDAEIHVETRYVNRIPEEDEIKCFLKELLLGPMANRYRPLFAKGTTLESCFIRDGVLFIDLSENALLKSGSSSETERACELLKENIMKNFSTVTDIKIFISGTEAYRRDNVLIVDGD